jgi:hypothetical protein
MGGEMIKTSSAVSADGEQGCCTGHPAHGVVDVSIKIDYRP